MNDTEKLLVSKSAADSLREALADARADRASDYINGFGDGVEYAMRVLGMEEAKG
jgi:hypothetical protein